jgi:DNA-binding NarL/FixJ family response regulator
MNSMMKPQATPKSIRVLIVDDIARVRKDLRTVLLLTGNNAGITIEIIGEAANGQEAVQLAEVLQPEVILMDLAMPVLDGFEATWQIKKHAPTCKVIALTVHDYEAARQKAAQSGVDVLFVKGGPVDQLVQTIAGQAHAASANQPG